VTDARSGATVEYALIIGEVSLGSVAGLRSVAAEVSCILYTGAHLLDAVAGPNLGLVQTLHISPNDCDASSEPATDPGTAPSGAGGPGNQPPSPGAPPTGCNKGDHEHHMLPQQFRDRFAQCGIPDIDAPQYMRCVPQRCHTGKGGLHPSGWNPLWAGFLGPLGTACPSVPDILSYMSQLEQQFTSQFNCE
jgi:hypothetical protein